MAFLERMKVVHRIAILAALTLVGILMIIWESASSADEVLMDDRLLKTRHVVEVAHGVVRHFQEMEASGQMTKADAQRHALAALKGLRYEEQEYFWVNDMHPKMVMHPFKPELDGKDLSDFKDPKGTKLFNEFVDTVRKSGGGFVSYLWPKPGMQDPMPKISYVKGFAPWGWVIGSGIYVDDVDHLFWKHTAHSLMLALILTVLLVVTSWLVGRSITRQLGGEPTYAMGIADRVAGGDLTTEIALREGDSHSVLHALKVMQDGLTDIIRRIQGGTREIAQAADRLVAISESIRDAGANQAEAASSTASAVNQISTSIGHVSDSANETERNSVRTSDLSKSGEKLAEEASQGISAIAATVDVATRQIQSLKGRMSEISTFSKVIKEIADQTNLLALNAAIEAARAGEQGRGFAVVADEVRKLAERASNATSQIAEVIRAVEGETQTTVGSIEAIVPQVGRGVQLSGEAAKSLNQINLGAEQTLSRVREVAHAMGELRQAADSISSNIEQIADMVEKNSGAIRTSSESSRNLRTLAGQLQEAVSRFRTAA